MYQASPKIVQKKTLTFYRDTKTNQKYKVFFKKRGNQNDQKISQTHLQFNKKHVQLIFKNRDEFQKATTSFVNRTLNGLGPVAKKGDLK